MLDETFNKERIYLSTEEDRLAIFINGKWQVFYSEQAILELNSFAAENFKKKQIPCFTEAFLKLNKVLTVDELQKECWQKWTEKLK